VNLRRPPDVPAWFVVPDAASGTFGGVYAAWALMKTVGSIVPRMQCGGPPPAAVRLAVAAGVVEAVIGVALAIGRPAVRRGAALAGVGVNVGLIGFAAVASARGLSTDGCGCFGGVDPPWSVHASIAGALALVFLAVLLDAERRRAAASA